MIFVDYDKRINDPDELAITTNSESDLIVNAPPVMLTFFEREIA